MSYLLTDGCDLDGGRKEVVSDGGTETTRRLFVFPRGRQAERQDHRRGDTDRRSWRGDLSRVSTEQTHSQNPYGAQRWESHKERDNRLT